MNKPAKKAYTADTVVKTFSNSESPELLFEINSNIQEGTLRINTNYTDAYKVRIIDYYARTSKLYRQLSYNSSINIQDFIGGIFIVNITDKRNKLLTSQVLNLRLRPDY